MNLQSIIPIVNEAQLPEPVHEETDPRAGCAHHLREGLLTDPGYDVLGHIFFSEVSEQQQSPGQSLFAGVKELVNQVLFVSDIPSQ